MQFHHKLAAVFAALILFVLAVSFLSRGGIPECDVLAGISQKFYCYENYPAPKRAAFDCSQLSTTENWHDTSTSLRDQCYYDHAGYLVDVAMCEKIVSIGKRNQCYLEDARTDTKTCEKIVNDEELKALCYQHVASWKAASS